MLFQILANTPTWVFLLFIVLLAFGLMQTRTRAVAKIPALLLPAGMIALSLAGINSSFGLTPVPLASWAIALSMSVLVGHTWLRDQRVEYDASKAKFQIPGSWVPLGVIMAIFFAKYVFAVMRALDAEVLAAPLFIVFLSAVYGLLSGYFAARAFNLIQKAQMV